MKKKMALYLIILLIILTILTSLNSITAITGGGIGANVTIVSGDTTAPLIESISPLDGTSITEGNVNYIFNVTDLNSISSCNLYIGDKTISNTSAISKSILNTIIGSRESGNYIWHINCTDSSNNVGNSSFRNIILTKAVQGSSGGGGRVIISLPTNISNVTFISEFLTKDFKKISIAYNNTNLTMFFPTKWVIGKVNLVRVLTYYKNELVDFSNLSYEINPINQYILFKGIEKDKNGSYILQYHVLYIPKQYKNDNLNYYNLSLRTIYNFTLEAEIKGTILQLKEKFILIDLIKEKKDRIILYLSLFFIIILITVYYLFKDYFNKKIELIKNKLKKNKKEVS